MGKRGERIPQPPPPGGWTLRFDSASAAEGWRIISDQFPGPTRRAFEQLETEPLARSDRQHRLHGSQGSATVGGRSIEQWQYELTGGARILCGIDPDRRTVWIIEASAGHPKQTEPGVRRR